MPIPVYCPECQKTYRIADSQAGMQVRCPNGHVMSVPQAGPPPVPEPAAAEIVADATIPRVPTDDNPYASPLASGGPFVERTFSKPKVIAPAVALLLLSGLAFGLGVLGIFLALMRDAPPVIPDQPEFVRALQQGSVGPLAAILQSIFVVTSLITMIGAIQMIRLKSWALAVTGSILMMVNVGNCCCLIGAPLGVWSLVILLQNDVKAAFEANRR